jgi:hypothetical protein
MLLNLLGKRVPPQRKNKKPFKEAFTLKGLAFRN